MRKMTIQGKNNMGSVPIFPLIGFAGGDANLKRYVHNNVVNRIDPLGLSDALGADAWANYGTYGANYSGFYNKEAPTHKINSKGLACNVICNVGNGMVSTALFLSQVGRAYTVPFFIAGRGFCLSICPATFEKCAEEKGSKP